MRIAIVGQQDFGKAVLEVFLARGDEVAGVFCAPEKPGARPDALKVAAQDIVTIPKHGTIQYRPSLLPKYRGPSSINWPIIRGDSRTGLSIFRPTEGLDEGPIVLQKECDIGPDETIGDVYFNKLYPMGVKAILEAADLVAAGKHQGGV